MTSRDLNEISGHEAYEIYVGSITPQELLGQHGNDPAAAAKSILADWPWEEAAPEGLEDKLQAYLEKVQND